MTDFLFLLALQSTDIISDSEINLVTQVWMRAQSDIRLHRNSSGRLFLCYVSGSKASIFVRKTLQVRLRDRNMLCMFQARKAGPAFFDEDDVCGRALDLGCSLPELELYYTRYQPF